ncbi:MAG: SAM-dependent methyltransferase [Bacteroidales bacterium]
MKGTLFLIPNLLSDSNPNISLPAETVSRILELRYFIIEEERAARRFLVRLGMKELLSEIEFGFLNEHTQPDQVMNLLQPIKAGSHGGVLSEAGCPGVADPGSEVVRLAHEQGIQVKPLTGPSSILLALMASGLNGQRFSFHGYLPIKAPDRIRRIKDLEQRSKQLGETQLFIEAPYRNRQLMTDLIAHLSPDTLLSVSAGLNSDKEYIRTAPVWQWHNNVPDLHKIPTVFLFLKIN